MQLQQYVDSEEMLQNNRKAIHCNHESESL